MHIPQRFIGRGVFIWTAPLCLGAAFFFHVGCGASLPTTGDQQAGQNGNTAALPGGTTAKVQDGYSGIIGTGQSLSVGFQGPLSGVSSPAPGGLRLSDQSGSYDITQPNSPNLSLVPLTEPFRSQFASGSTSVAYPNNIAGQSPHSAMAAQVSGLAQAAGYTQYTTVHSAVGIGGAPMSDINRGGAQNSYAASLFEARALTALVAKQNKALHYDAIVFTHGEADAQNINTHYEQDLAALQAAYVQDLPAITGQASTSIPMLLSQEQTNPVPGTPLSPVIQAQWHAQVVYPGRIICTGPKYQYVYAAGLLHLPATGYDRLGEKYGQAFYQTVVNKTPFVPLSPLRVVRTNINTITLSLSVPTPPLNWDDLLPKPHQTANTAWMQGRGFEVTDPNGVAVTIASAQITDPNGQVTLTLSGAPTAALTVNYAMTADVNGWEGGVAGGRIGHLRDSDPLVGASAETLACQVTLGSPNITCPQGLAKRAYYDRVTPGTSAVTGLNPNALTQATLSAPWSGASGTQNLFFQHEHRNYLVSFTMPATNP